MALIAGSIVSTFPLFARNMTYRRGATSVSILGFKRDARPEELVGDIDQINGVVIMRCQDLSAAGFWPPEKNDRIVDVTGAYKVWSSATEYDGETPVLCRIKVIG